MTQKKPVEPPADFGTVEDWAPFIGSEDATQMLSGLGALGGSQELLEQLTQAVLPGGPAVAAVPLSAEEQLRRAELRFRSLVENLPCVAFVASMGQGRSEVYINRYIEQLLGYTREEWLRDPFLWYWRVHPEDRAIWNEEFARGLVSGGPWQMDCRFLRADGQAVWVRGHARIVRDELGRPLFLQGIAFDIGTIKQAQFAERASRQEAVSALDALPEALVVLGPEGRVSHVNKAARALLGLEGALPAGSLELPALAQALAPGSANTLVERIEHCRRAGTRDTIAIAEPGRVLEIECLASPAAAGLPTVLKLRAAASHEAPAAPAPAKKTTKK